ncbi:hypothetical protein C8R47DRAFT_1076153 [Mycena vitilis]|nr:hypothetical protein C8R47DRAFT_1076153 [Mycena vitilis]
MPDTFKIREIVLASVPGFPPWPCMVVDPDTVPESSAKERPANEESTVYAIRFFPSGDYAWLAPNELSRLTAAEMTAYLAQESEGRKADDFTEGYKKALNPAAVDDGRAAHPPAAQQRKIKAEENNNGEEDELSSDEEGRDEMPAEEKDEEKVGKKRKRTSCHPSAKGKAKAPEASDGGEETQAEGEKLCVDGEARAVRAAEASATKVRLQSDPEAVKVREWRHKLQKIFLNSKRATPKSEEMPAIHWLFTAIEAHEFMSPEYLTFSKIGKVMRHIYLLEPGKIPRDGEFKFRVRAKALVEKWHSM